MESMGGWMLLKLFLLVAIHNPMGVVPEPITQVMILQLLYRCENPPTRQPIYKPINIINQFYFNPQKKINVR